ncbi:MAG: UDP-N-acetylglucosamine 2-epimerase (hydrolyzing) [Magnetococcales bacterium]|nr:UDP-N-acetylglucosamine 2-epimerase (hydrolyzing) [Magnetococcales bacterium]
MASAAARAAARADGRPPRRILAVTGSRAEYGHLQWVLREIAEAPDLELRLAATGAHLAAEHGLTAGEMEADGFSLDARIPLPLPDDGPLAIARAIGAGVAGFAEVYARLRPDLLLILGDRYEMLAAACAALPLRLPIAHLHGGETSQGAMDEAIRHTITKMAHLHFTAAEPYRRRVIQLGEDPARVFNFGAPGLDHLTRGPALLSREAWRERFGFELGRVNFLVTYHPVTLEADGPQRAVAALLAALDLFPEARVIFTKANADAEGRAINALLEAYAAQRPGRAALFDSLGPLGYLSALALVDAVVGNSSSGIIEAPFFRVPTVNLGDRQKGRLRAASVIDCPEQAEAIAAAIRRALSPEFRASLAGMASPYGQGDAARKIVQVLRSFDLTGILKKEFHDLPSHGETA